MAFGRYRYQRYHEWYLGGTGTMSGIWEVEVPAERHQTDITEVPDTREVPATTAVPEMYQTDNTYVPDTTEVPHQHHRGTTLIPH